MKVDKSGEEEPLVIAKKVGKTLSVNVKNGKIGSLKVKPKIELRGVFKVCFSLSFLHTSLPCCCHTLIPSFFVHTFHFITCLFYCSVTLIVDESKC